jgi:hypothetical protein
VPDELILPLSAKNRKVWRYFAILFPAVMVALFLGPWVVSGISFDELRVMMELGLGWFFAPVALAPVLFAYIGLTNLTDRLVFTDTQFERRGLRNPAIYRGPVAYPDITRVRVGGYGLLILETNSGKRFRLFPKAYEGGAEAVIAGLHERVPLDRFEDDLDAGLEQKTRRDRLTPWIAVLAVWLIVMGGLIDPVIDLLRRNRAWTLEIDGRSMGETIEGFALGRDGSLWLFARDRKGGILDSASYLVRSLNTDRDQTWDVPGEDVLFPGGVPEFSLPFPTHLLLPPAGEPRLIFGADVTALRLSGGGWEWEERTETGLSGAFADLTEWTGDPYWRRLQTEGKFLARDPLSGDVQEIALAGEGRSFTLEYKRYVPEALLARIVTGDQRFFLAKVQGGDQELVWDEVDLAPFRARDYWKVLDYAGDRSGALYALVRDDQYCASGHPASSLGQRTAGGSAWHWWTVTQAGECRDASLYGQLVVDGRDRIWLSTLWDLTVLPPGALKSGAASGAIHYSEDNSGYMAGRQLELGPDGRIWSLDFTGDGLAWINSNSEELGKPLPEWIAALPREPWWRLAPAFAGMVLMLGGLVWNRRDSTRGSVIRS